MDINLIRCKDLYPYLLFQIIAIVLGGPSIRIINENTMTIKLERKDKIDNINQNYLK